MIDSPEASITILPTSNEWDAPLFIGRYADGRWVLNRTGERPEGDFHRTYLAPHCVVMVNGEMTPFDAERQP